MIILCVLRLQICSLKLLQRLATGEAILYIVQSLTRNLHVHLGSRKIHGHRPQYTRFCTEY